MFGSKLRAVLIGAFFGFASFIVAQMLYVYTDGSLVKRLFEPEVTVEEWEHGFKTEYVIATRYLNKWTGYNIGFRFPHHIHDSDSPELFNWFSQYGGTVDSGGGCPGAEVFVVFEGVDDKESANAKLKEIMVPLTAFMRARK